MQLLLPDIPPAAVFKGYEDFVVRDLILKPRVNLYRREHWLSPDGRSLVAPFPADVLPGSHFGPDLICFILCPGGRHRGAAPRAQWGRYPGRQ
jgi:hypothetical protein